MAEFNPKETWEKSQSNPVGIVGFALAITSFFLFWIPVLGWLLWIGGLVCSIIGVTKQSKQLSIAGLIVSGGTLVTWLLIYAIIWDSYWW